MMEQTDDYHWLSKESSLGKQYADLIFLNDNYNFSSGDESEWTTATKAEHQPKSHT